MLEGVGRLLVKAIFDGQPVPAPFAPSLYKYLLGVTPNLHDLAAYDPSLADQLRMLLDAEDAEDMGVDFEDVGGECEEVTNDNRARCVLGTVCVCCVLCVFCCVVTVLVCRSRALAQLLSTLIHFH